MKYTKSVITILWLCFICNSLAIAKSKPKSLFPQFAPLSQQMNIRMYRGNILSEPQIISQVYPLKTQIFISGSKDVNPEEAINVAQKFGYDLTNIKPAYQSTHSIGYRLKDGYGLSQHGGPNKFIYGKNVINDDLKTPFFSESEATRIAKDYLENHNLWNESLVFSHCQYVERGVCETVPVRMSAIFSYMLDGIRTYDRIKVEMVQTGEVVTVMSMYGGWIPSEKSYPIISHDEALDFLHKGVYAVAPNCSYCKDSDFNITHMELRYAPFKYPEDETKTILIPCYEFRDPANFKSPVLRIPAIKEYAEQMKKLVLNKK